jgi:hypothetical protein
LRLDRNGLPVISSEDLSKVVTIDGFSKPKSKKLDIDAVPPYTKRVPRKLDFEVR